jgi:hypothetical protein
MTVIHAAIGIYIRLINDKGKKLYIKYLLTGFEEVAR